MSIYSDLRKVVALVDLTDQLSQEVVLLRQKVSDLEKEVATLKGREEAVILLSEKAARKATQEVVESMQQKTISAK